jgi:hypothetical protein
VAKGCSQTERIDYSETFTPVVKHSSIRLLFALAAKHDWNIDHLDVCTAFLNGDIEDEIYIYIYIYMELPEVYDIKGASNKVCKLKKSVYGLKQAARSWNKKATEVLKGLEYNQTCSEPCIYTKRKDDSVINIALYVHDLIFYNDNAEVRNLKSKLQQYFKVFNLIFNSYTL